MFFRDKNNILRESQFIIRESLLKEVLLSMRGYYLAVHNPMGLMDDFIHLITKTDSFDCSGLYDFYEQMAAIYRFKYDDGQLCLLFETVSHEEKYISEWSKSFLDSTREFSVSKSFLETVFEIVFFSQDIRRTDLAKKRLKVFLDNKMQMCVYKKQELKSVKSLKKLVSKNKRKSNHKKSKKVTWSKSIATLV